MQKTISIVLLAGGTGTRFGSPLPKQYALLKGLPVALHSFHFFSRLPEVREIIVVCEKEKEILFPSETKFALPGKQRQDSAKNGFLRCDPASSLIAFHDAARPLLSEKKVRKTIEAAKEYGAAALALRATHTIKKTDKEGFVLSTLDRSSLWLLNTPQILERSLAERGFREIDEGGKNVTDDLSMIESFHATSRLIEDWPYNLKITYPEDLKMAELFLQAQTE